MDKRIRINELCVVGLPRCDFAFSSTRSCFIAYGFAESSLEMGLLRRLLEERGIQGVEAGGTTAAGQNAFCAKICSKIITSQFCIVLLNNDTTDGKETPNANVNMEYGLMLGFNKYVIPFQRSDQRLPFNVAGLDTVKYTSNDFERKAADAIDRAIEATRQDSPQAPLAADQIVDTFVLRRRMLFTHVDNPGEQNLFRLGVPLGFNLLNDFAGLQYAFLGRFASLRPETVLWRIGMLDDILKERVASIPTRIENRVLDAEYAERLTKTFKTMKVWVIVATETDKAAVQEAMQDRTLAYPVEIFATSDISSEVESATYAG